MSRPRLMDFYAELGHHLGSRLLLSETEYVDHETYNITDTDCSLCDDHELEIHHDNESAFQHIYFVMLFMACLWFIGKLFARCGLPALVGEILCGIVLGPNLLGFVPYSDALIVIGEIGLVLLVLEAGIDVSIGHLKVVGYRGLAVAVFGSMLPLGIGTGLAVLYGNELQSAIAIGACLAPTSMGIALNVLRNAKVLNTPTGQLIIAAAVLDDVIGLMLLSELEAIADPTLAKILLPLIVSPAFLILFGFLAIKVTPWLIQNIMMKTSKHQHENVILLLLFVATFTLLPVCFVSGASYLLGAFLAGLMFCTDHTIHEAWNNQIKRIMQWMLRVFFACTIGFAVPIQDFWSKPVVIGGCLYFIAVIAKVLTGIFAKPFTASKFFTIAFSMSIRGEFAFILAAASFETASIDKNSYSSILMAVLMSAVISPLCLRATLQISNKQQQKKLTGARSAHYNYNDEGDAAAESHGHPVYFCVHTKAVGKWGHQDKLLHAIFSLNLEIIDFRSFNEAEYNYTHHLPIAQDVFYVLDTTLSLPPTKKLDKLEERKLQQRYKTIKRSLKETMADPGAKVDVMRWLPGVRRHEDKKKKSLRTMFYCRKEAYKQARLAINNEATARSSSHIVSGISRVRPTHDALYRDHFTYHGGIHTEQDDLVTMTFFDTLQSLVESLSPPNRSSPTGSIDRQPLNHEELFEKIETLRSCAEQLPLFHKALSDDDSDDYPKSFDAQYAQTFGHGSLRPPLYKNISAESLEGMVMNGAKDMDIKDIKYIKDINDTKDAAGDGISEHGSILGLMHNKPSSVMRHKSPSIPSQPGMFLSHSHGILPGHTHSKFFDHVPRDVLAGYHHNVPSMTGSSDHNPLHVSSTESDSSTKSDDMHCDTMYGDEDQRHRSLYTNLDDLDEEDAEEDEEDAEEDEDGDGDEDKKDDGLNLKKTSSMRLKRSSAEKKAPKRKLKRSTTWSRMKLFGKKLSDDDDDDESDNGRSGKKKGKKKRKKIERAKSKDELSSCSAQTQADDKKKAADNDEDELCETQPLKSGIINDDDDPV